MELAAVEGMVVKSQVAVHRLFITNLSLISLIIARQSRVRVRGRRGVGVKDAQRCVSAIGLWVERNSFCGDGQRTQLNGSGPW